MVKPRKIYSKEETSARQEALYCFIGFRTYCFSTSCFPGWRPGCKVLEHVSLTYIWARLLDAVHNKDAFALPCAPTRMARSEMLVA